VHFLIDAFVIPIFVAERAKCYGIVSIWNSWVPFILKTSAELNGHTVQLLLTKVTLPYHFQYALMKMAYFWRVMSERRYDKLWRSI